MSVSRINGIRLYWQTTGTAGDPLVLVHGSWGDRRNWAPVVPALSRSFRVLTYDRRGHSRSERPVGKETFGRMLQILPLFWTNSGSLQLMSWEVLSAAASCCAWRQHGPSCFTV